MDEIALTPSENRRVKSLLVKLQPLQSVRKALHDESATVSSSRVLLDAVIGNFQETTHRLPSSADILHSPLFKSGLVKIQRGNVSASHLEE